MTGRPDGAPLNGNDGIFFVYLNGLSPLLVKEIFEIIRTINDEGVTMHPDRYPEKGQQGLVVFSAGGNFFKDFGIIKELRVLIILVATCHFLKNV